WTADCCPVPRAGRSATSCSRRALTVTPTPEASAPSGRASTAEPPSSSATSPAPSTSRRCARPP
ncbi:MAG: hypothetical protein AVDCRST_MAG57-1300, partial [uncultured Blastococcus sp.]